MSTKIRYLLLILVLIIVAGSIWYLESLKTAPTNSNTISEGIANSSSAPTSILFSKEQKYVPAKELVGIDGYINTPPFKLKELIGKKVILVDFWTYSCINCQRTLPYLTAWYQKYKDQGLEIVGVHTPEFEFEKIKENVEKATQQFGITYPVVQDNEYGTWLAYGNRYWPHHYLIDIDGFVVSDHIGEGGYDETEKEIQALLAERAQRLNMTTPVASGYVKPVADVAANDISPETYFGSARNEYLGNGKSGAVGKQTFTLPSLGSAQLDMLYLGGTWNMQDEYAESVEAETKIVFHYKAKGVYLVAGSSEASQVKVLVDGKPLSNGLGSDVHRDSQGNAVFSIKDERLYRIIQSSNEEEHTIELIIEKPGVRVFTFTFG